MNKLTLDDQFTLSESKYSISNIKTEAASQRCSAKKVFLEILQNSQENTCARVSFLIKLKRPATLLIKRF